MDSPVTRSTYTMRLCQLFPFIAVTRVIVCIRLPPLLLCIHHNQETKVCQQNYENKMAKQLKKGK